MKSFFFFSTERKRMENGQNLRLWLWFFCLFVVFSLSVFVFSLCLSLSLSLSLSPSLFLPYTFFYLSKRERGGGLDTIDDANFLTSCAVCVCVGGGGCKVSCLSCFFSMWRERDNVKLIFVFDFKKEKLSRVWETWHSSELKSFFIIVFFFRVYC